MRREPHPITGYIYEELGDGVVLVSGKDGKQGKFKWDGSWLEGDVTQADPHFLIHVGGPTLRPENNVFWGYLPPAKGEASAASAGSAYGANGLAPVRAVQPKMIGKYIADPGKQTGLGMRSSGHVDLAFYLDNDRKPEAVPEVYRLESPMPGGPQRVSTDRFHEQRFHDLEVERIWKRTWQMACREDDIPNVGDYHVYEIAHLSYLVVRTGENEFRAHQNICLHRGRKLRECDGKGATEFRCPFHGWSWKLDGSLKEITCEWDFPGVREDVAKLPSIKVETWAGFVFINPDPQAEPLKDFLGPVMMAHYDRFRFEGRYKQAHVIRPMQANWKVTMEAFMEAYHVIATHPQQMLTGGDNANQRYDVFGNWGRAGHFTPSTVSPQRGIYRTPEELLAEYRNSADANRDYLTGILGEGEAAQYSDAELNDNSFNNLFPNLHPWGGWGRIVFRFRPNGSNPNESLMDVMLLAPWPKGKAKPAPAPLHRLGSDQTWCDAPELGALARILDQDVNNVAKVQAGVRAKDPAYVWYSSYQEGKIRQFHKLYQEKLGLS